MGGNPPGEAPESGQYCGYRPLAGIPGSELDARHVAAISVLGAALVIAGAWLASRSEQRPLNVAPRPNRPDDQDTAIPDM
jgi:hypothetical protein